MSAVNILADLKGRLMPFVSGSVTPSELLPLLSDGARDFALASRTLTNKVTTGLVADQALYALVPEMDGRILQIEHVWTRTTEDIEEDEDGTLVPEHGFAWYPDEGAGSLELLGGYVPASSLADGLRVEFSVVPDPYVTDGFPTWWLSEHAEAIVWSCRALLGQRPEATDQQVKVAGVAAATASSLANKARAAMSRYGRPGPGRFYL